MGGARVTSPVVGEPSARRPSTASPSSLPPNSAAASASNPFGDICSDEMGSGSSFTDLIMDGLPPVTVSENVPPNELLGHDEVPGPNKGNHKRSKNFTVDEDKLLVSAWLNVSLDAVRGTNQSKTTYWKRIHEYFHANKDFESDRSQPSLMSRWSSILHDCNNFCHCVSRVEARNQSRASVDDKQANVLTMYKKEDRFHKTFQYIHCWKILKDQAKWKERIQHIGPQKPANKKQKTVPSSTPATEASIPASSNADKTQTNLDRPAGTKKEKEKLRQRSSIEVVDYLLAKKKEADAEKELKKEERDLKKQERDLKKQESCQKALALQEEKIKLEKEKFEFERDLQEERIMNVDMSSLSAKQQEFYALLQDKILAKRLG